MSTLTTESVQKIADLAKLHISSDKLPALTDALKNILTLVKKMDDANTQDVQALSHSVSATQPLREDIITEKDQRDLFQKNAPQVEAGLYIVPKFVESE
ncbi:MAG: asparaginyl/glutamyl-tRNA amidotransferase subunit C [Gammaproteobacteria bacterium RIFCSPHIGHO2_12_FULL_42_10]|nr:MAG: asparaginyl/glutamyl-tRNA amidotransferase subunit C [Gammaproteobacteria bacterium RIFCSPHIGHO2_12_FULL_42_10]